MSGSSDENTPTKKSIRANVHTDYFEIRFQTQEQFKSIFKLAFSERILSYFDLDTIQPESTHWVRTEPERLSERRADLVLSVVLKSGDEANVVIIVEHKSTPDQGLMEQLNRYHAICSEQGNKFIMPVVVYHGKQRSYPKSWESYHDYLKTIYPPELINLCASSIQNFKPIVVNLRDQATYKRLSSLPLATGLSLKLMAEVWEASLETFTELTNSAMALQSQECFELITQSGLYLRGARSESFTMNEIKKVVEDRNVGDEIVEKIKKEWLWITEPGTVGGAYYQGRNEGQIEGRQEGWQEGVKEGREEGVKEGREEKSYEVATKMIADGMTTQKISEITGLSIAQINALR